LNHQERKIISELEKAREAYLRKDYLKALRLYKWIEQQILDDDVNLPVIQIEIGWTYYNLKDYKNCIQYLKKVEENKLLTNTQRFDCKRLIGFSHEYLGDNEKAIQYIEKSIKENVDVELQKYALFELGKIYFIKGAMGKAKPYLLKAKELFKTNALKYKLATAYYLGFIAFYEKDFQTAYKYFSNIVENAKDAENEANGYFGLAHLYYEEKKYPVLIDISQKILRLNPKFYDKETLGFFLCKSYREMKMFNDLKTFYNELLQNYPEGRYKEYYPVFEESLEKLFQK
jgi:tetratricopeptide (TPR) repeat protein